MDPIETYQRWVEDGSPRARRDLNEWLGRGGFRPRVELSPATDAWMAGDRYGDVVKVGTRYAHVKCDRSGLVRLVPPTLLRVVR